MFKAFNKKTGQLAAVKVMESISEVVEEIEEEFLILKELSNHPNLPKFFGTFLKKGESEDQLWLVMELCKNGSVTDLVKSLKKKGKNLDELMIAHILKETVKALQHLHHNHVMHRDVKVLYLKNKFFLRKFSLVF